MFQIKFPAAAPACAVLALNCLLATPFLAPAQAPEYPFPRHILYSPGAIRPSHRTPAQLDDDVRAFYNYWKTQYLKPAGTTGDGRPRYRVSYGSTNPARTVSEGQGYGMVIVPLMAGYDPNAHGLFDGLYEFALAYPSAIDARLMTWEVPITPGESTSAFDGDADIAYGLMLAHAQWGSTGRVDYARAARSRLAGILASTIGPQSRLPMLGDWVEAGGVQYNQYTPRSSDFMPGHFRAWARFTGNAVWKTVASNCASVVTALQAGFSPVTGLLPDFIVHSNAAPRPAPPGFLEGATDGDYSYNAGRDPWRLAVDALLNGDAASTGQAKKIAAWLKTRAAGNPQNIRAGYHLDGSNISGNNYFTSFFVAPVGVAAMLETTNHAWLNALYDSVRAQHEDYYEDSVTLLCLLAMSGNFWDPTTISEQPRRIATFALPPEGLLHALVSNNEPTVTFSVNALATNFAFAVERSTNLSTWTLLAHRTNGASFQAVAGGVTVAQTNQTPFTAVRVNDGAALNIPARFYRVRITP